MTREKRLRLKRNKQRELSARQYAERRRIFEAFQARRRLRVAALLAEHMTP
jgi:DNA-binding GntR family transcriptional regulator